MRVLFVFLALGSLLPSNVATQQSEAPSPSSYLTPGRLADVLTLIQILAFEPDAVRSVGGLQEELQRTPLSGKTWSDVAKIHPEFFHISRDKGQPEAISLVARFVLPEIQPEGGGQAQPPPLTAEVTSTLLNLAVQLHDREMQRRDRWINVLVPMVVAIVAAGASVIAAVLSASKGRNGSRRRNRIRRSVSEKPTSNV